MGIPDRRQFLGAMASIGAMAATGKSEAFGTASSASSVRWPKLTGSPVLDSLHPVIEHSRDVHTHVDKIVEVARLQRGILTIVREPQQFALIRQNFASWSIHPPQRTRYQEGGCRATPLGG